MSTRTDNRVLETLLVDDDTWCHIRNRDGKALCRGSGAGDGRPAKLVDLHRDTGGGPYCTGCGRRNCPDCELLWREGKR